MTARTSRLPEGHHDSQHGGNPHFRAAPKKKSKRKTERDNARAAEFQSKKKKEDTKQAAATGTEKTSEKGNETEAASEKDKEIVEVEESEMTISSLESSPELRKFIFASPVQETLRHDTSREASMILDDEVEHQDKIEVDNDGPIDDPDEETLDEDKADKADENHVDKDNSDEDIVDGDKDGEENVDKLYDRLLDFLERHKLRCKLEQERFEQEKELEDVKRLSLPEKLDRLQQESNRIEKVLSGFSEIEYLIGNYHILSRNDILSRLDILEQQQEEKRTFPALGPQTGQR